MLKLEALKLQLGDFSLDADFSIPGGSRVAIVGPSGAGKSTLLNALAGFITPQSGCILFESKDLTELEPGKRPMSLVFQDNNLFPHLTVFENIAVGIRPSMKLSPDEVKAVHGALGRVGLGAMADRKPAALSGGQVSRVALARVLVRARPLILLDEPFAALGPALKTEMLDLVAELAAATQATLLMVTHDLSDARRIATQTVLVEGGIAHAPQETQALLDSPPASLKAYMGASGSF